MGQIIFNLTQHQATPEQVAQGVKDLEPEQADVCRRLLTFNDGIPSAEDLQYRGRQLAHLAVDLKAEAVMIGGAPYFMAPLESALKEVGIRPLYAYSKRESVDQPQPDGTVVKTMVFRHIGFVEA